MCAHGHSPPHTFMVGGLLECAYGIIQRKRNGIAATRHTYWIDVKPAALMACRMDIYFEFAGYFSFFSSFSNTEQVIMNRIEHKEIPAQRCHDTHVDLVSDAYACCAPLRPPDRSCTMSSEKTFSRGDDDERRYKRRKKHCKATRWVLDHTVPFSYNYTCLP